MTLELLHVRHARDHLLFYQKLCQHSGFVENVCLSMKKTMMCQCYTESIIKVSAGTTIYTHWL